MVIGVNLFSQFVLSPRITAGSTGMLAQNAIYLDGVTPITYISNYNAYFIECGNTALFPLAPGYHYVSVYEYGNNANCTFNQMIMTALLLN